MHRVALGLLIGCGFALVWSPVDASPPTTPPPTPPATVPDDAAAEPDPDDSTSTSGTAARATQPRRRLVPIPAGCPKPPDAEVVFVGKLVNRDANTGRFELQQVRAGSADRFSRDGVIDIRYEIDTKYLADGGQYLVGAGLGPSGVLVSKVRAEQPMFGGDDVVGVTERDVDCPVVEDPVRTLTVNGRSIESGVFEPLGDSRGRLLGALAVPGLVAFAIVIGLVAVRLILTGAARGTWQAIARSRLLGGPGDEITP